MKGKWTLDPAHSTVQFSVRHLGISTVKGLFTRFSGIVICGDDGFNGAMVSVAVDPASINTQHPERDEHLRSKDFFNTARYSQILFTGRLTEENESYKLKGDLTICGTTRAVLFEVECGGTGRGRFGDARAGFEVYGKINRKDFGLTWNMLIEAGQQIVGEEVKLHFNVQVFMPS